MTPAAVNNMNATVDLEYLRYEAESGGCIREHFCGPEPALVGLLGVTLVAKSA
jgi:pyruvate dehydrogenase complex dehydrogenase (E1) component